MTSHELHCANECQEPVCVEGIAGIRCGHCGGWMLPLDDEGNRIWPGGDEPVEVEVDQDGDWTKGVDP